MSLIDHLDDHNLWVGFYDKKADQGYLRGNISSEIFHYIRQKRYLPVVERIRAGQGLSIPVKKRIAKVASSKKRIVYSLPEDEANVLKLLTWLMIRRYDSSLSDNLYSFRPGKTIKTALNRILSGAQIDDCYSYKLDVSNYFNSIHIPTLLPMLRELFSDDPQLYEFAAQMLTEPHVVDDGNVVVDEKGVMAGMPTAVFFANLYLSDLDRAFENMPGVVYCRYSDDIIVFAQEKDVLEKCKSMIHEHLRRFRLEVNPDKEVETEPGEKWTFLGISYLKGEIDISDISFKKMKGKMRRKARRIQRWKDANGKEVWMAARAFIKHFNRKLYTSEDPHQINWARWYFPLITTDRTLKELDAYMQDCIRFCATGRRTKSRYDFRYSDMKDQGYRSLVHEWYAFKQLGHLPEKE